MKTITAVIVEDEHLESELLNTFLTELGGIDVVSIADDESSAIMQILMHKPDLVFFDIHLNGKPAFDVIKAIKNANIETQIVFTTAFEEYAVKVFEFSNLPFLLKPIDKALLKDVIEKFRNNKLSNKISTDGLKYLERIKFKDNKGIIYITPIDIFYCESDGRYTKIYIDKKNFHLVSMNMKEIEEILNNYNFQRIHRSYLINMQYVQRFDSQKDTVILEKNGDKIILKVARANRGIFMN